MSFFEFINSQHPNIKFTFEKQNDGKLSFLDILVDNCVFSVFHKENLHWSLNKLFLVLICSAIKLALSELSLTELLKSTTLLPVFTKFDQAFRHSQT